MTTPKDSQSNSTGFGFKSVMFGVRKKFSEVNQMSTESLYRLFFPDGNRHQKELLNTLILDVRDKSERDVSWIGQSDWIDYSKDINANVDHVHDLISQRLSSTQDDENLHVIAYCSVGYRSSELLSALNKSCASGRYSHCDKLTISNLEGSLFKWANEGRPIVTSGNVPTTYVHPYNSFWGRLLNSDLHKR